MASKEDIDRRAQDEASKVYASYDGRHPSIPEQEAMAVAVRPLVERVIELEEERFRLGDRADRMAPKLAAAEERVIELDRQVHAVNADRSRVLADLGEARAELRTATREHDETTAALRAQVAALQGVIDGHEQAIRDACADVRAEYEDERATDRARRTRLVDTIAALETTVDVLAGRLAARGA